MSVIGGNLFDGGSKLFSNPLGVIDVYFKGYYLGRTTDATTLAVDEDIQDIMYQQEGTKADDHVSTGVDLLLTTSFGEINTGLLNILVGEVNSLEAAGTGDSGVLTRNLYQSLRETEGGVLRLVAIDSTGCPSTDINDTMDFYVGIPILNGDLLNWSADTQRTMPTQFRIKWHTFPEPASCSGAFGYWGDPTQYSIPAVTWPNVTAPSIVSAQITTATDVVITFDQNIAFVGGSFAANDYALNLNDTFGVNATSGVISTTALTLTYPAATFTTGDIAKLSITAQAIQDTETTPNVYPGIDGLLLENTL